MDVATALVKARPGAKWSLTGDDLSGLDWKDESPPPTEAEITAAWETHLATPKPKVWTLDKLVEALKAKGVIGDADLK